MRTPDRATDATARPANAGARQLGIPPEQLLWVDAERTADALWAAEQMLRAGTCGVLILWQSHLRNDALRRLHLAAGRVDARYATRLVPLRTFILESLSRYQHLEDP